MRWLTFLIALLAPPVLAGEEAPVVKESCEAKQRCEQMRDCAEATFYLRQCGAGSLDRDGDGVPCEDLCAFKSTR